MANHGHGTWMVHAIIIDRCWCSEGARVCISIILSYYHIIILSCYHITIWSYDHSYHNIIWEKKKKNMLQANVRFCSVHIYIYIDQTVLLLIVLLYYYTVQFYDYTLYWCFFIFTLSCHLMLSYYFAIMLVYYCTVLLLCYFTVLLLYYRTIIITCVCYYTNSLSFTIIIIYIWNYCYHYMSLLLRY